MTDPTIATPLPSCFFENLQLFLNVPILEATTLEQDNFTSISKNHLSNRHFPLICL